MTIALLALILSAAPVAEPADADHLRLAVIDAEGGAAALFITPDGRSLLVDAGWPERNGAASTAELIADTASDLGLTQIDYVLISHYHLDHVGGLPALLERFPVGAVIDHGPNREISIERPPAPTSAEGLFEHYERSIAALPRHVVRPGDIFEIGQLSLTFVASDAEVIPGPLAGAGGLTPGCAETPDLDRIGGEENRRSLGFVARFGEARILNLGDVTWNVEKALVCPVNRIGPVDLLMVSHHGSELSNSPPLIAAAAPRVALMGNGAQKGGDQSVFETLRNQAPNAVLWQMHAAERTPDVNRPERYIANPAAHEGPGYGLSLTISADGEISITNPRQGFRESYPRP